MGGRVLSERCLANHWDFFQENQSTEGPHMLTACLRPETRSILVPEDTETLRKIWTSKQFCFSQDVIHITYIVWFECEMYLLYGLLCLNTWFEQLVRLCGKVVDLLKKKACRRNRIHGEGPAMFVYSLFPDGGFSVTKCLLFCLLQVGLYPIKP